MKTIIQSALSFCLVLSFTALSYAGTSATESFQIYVTLPPHVSTSVDEIALITEESRSIESQLPRTMMETEKMMRDNQSIVMQSIVVR